MLLTQITPVLLCSRHYSSDFCTTKETEESGRVATVMETADIETWIGVIWGARIAPLKTSGPRS